MNDLFAARGDFAEFWAAYPRKVARPAAKKAYAKALKIATHDEIMFGLSQQLPAMQSKEKQFVPHASTWLNQERWTDEPEEPANNNAKAANARGADAFDEARERALRSAARGPKRSDYLF